MYTKANKKSQRKIPSQKLELKSSNKEGTKNEKEIFKKGTVKNKNIKMNDRTKEKMKDSMEVRERH